MRIANFEDRSEMINAMPKGGVVAEIGVYKGAFAQNILDVVQPDTLHLIDKWDEPEIYQEVIDRFGDDPRVVIHKENSHSILPTFDDRYFDWVYVDANHDYYHIKRDIQDCLRLVKKWIAGHDWHTQTYFYTSISRAVVELIQDPTNDWQLVALTDNEDLSGWGLQQPGSSWVIAKRFQKLG
jgi:hypothetical protein